MFLEILENWQENTCARVSVLVNLQDLALNFMRKETLAQLFSFEFCNIFKNTVFIENLQATASAKLKQVSYFAPSFSLLSQV